jgi:hypothetical protein
MPEDPRPPVAIRITRPQTTEEEFLEQELETLNRTGVTLLGAQPRPQGVVLRFELVLSSGHVLMRGEGRVVGFRPNAHQGLGGLTLRFTRLDSRSKTLVDKATALRDRRRPSSSPGTPRVSDGSPPPAPVELPLALDALASARAEEPLPASAPLPGPPPRPPPLPPRPAVASQPPRSPPASLAGSAAPSQTPARAPSARALERPAARDALLERLRGRAKALDAAAVQRILAQRKRG